jgi:hypothetical protein
VDTSRPSLRTNWTRLVHDDDRCLAQRRGAGRCRIGRSLRCCATSWWREWAAPLTPSPRRSSGARRSRRPRRLWPPRNFHANKKARHRALTAPCPAAPPPPPRRVAQAPAARDAVVREALAAGGAGGGAGEGSWSEASVKEVQARLGTWSVKEASGRGASRRPQDTCSEAGLPPTCPPHADRGAGARRCCERAPSRP